MAVFLINVCKFDSCGLKFGSLQELIRHIEEYHVDLEPISLDAIGNTTCLPVSCILRLCSNRDESSIDLSSNTQNNNNESHIRKSINSPPVSLSTTPTGSELDGEDADSDSGQSSIDSWATANMNNATNNLLKYHQIMGSTVSTPNLDENNNNNTNSTKFLNGTAAGKEHREFICAISGCTKRYRNSNSLSHHRRSAHRFNNNVIITPKPTADESNKKIYNCFCGKTYKTSHGLKNHCNNHHGTNQTANAQGVNGSLCNSKAIHNSIHNNNNVNGNNHHHHQHHPNNQASNAASAVDIKPEFSSFVQMNSSPAIGTSKSSSTIKETLLNSITKAKVTIPNSSTMNGKISNAIGNSIQFNCGGFHSSEIISDANCPPVSNNVEIIGETKLPVTPNKCPPMLSAPTLQQHLLSPIIPKVASS